jgi:hypothetical protein
MPPAKSKRTQKIPAKAMTSASEISIPGAESSSVVPIETQRTPHPDSPQKKMTNTLSFSYVNSAVSYSLFCNVKLTEYSTPQSFVTLTIGPESSAQKFVVHKSLISHFSPVFSAAFSSSFVEGKTQSMTLTDVETQPFGLLIHWMYQQEIEGGKGGDIVQLAKLWLLGERFLIPKLQNEAMELLYEMIEPISTPQMQELLTLVYETKVDFPLKKIVMQRFIRLPPGNLQQWFKFFPAGMLEDITMAFANHVDALPVGYKIFKGPLEKYHVEQERTMHG